MLAGTMVWTGEFDEAEHMGSHRARELRLLAAGRAR
jgi:hypothetical protein